MKKNMIGTPVFFAVLVTGCVFFSHEIVANEPRPNIITILVDDLGYSDLGCYGGEIETPNLDQLAENGVRFTQFYNTSRCCPSRASLLTGLYQHQTGIGFMTYRDYGKSYRANLNRQCVTFAEVLKSAGYQTMMSGKWHVGHTDPKVRPELRGFEKFTGIYSHVDSYWKVLPGCEIYRDQKLMIKAQEKPVSPYAPKDEFYTTDFFTDVAIDYISQAKADKPFLMHLCYNVPHFPLETPDDLIEKYRGRYLNGWDKLRTEKLKRMKKMGIVSDDQKLPSVKGFRNQRIEDSVKSGSIQSYFQCGILYRPKINASWIFAGPCTLDRLTIWIKISADWSNTLSPKDCSIIP